MKLIVYLMTFAIFANLSIRANAQTSKSTTKKTTTETKSADSMPAEANNTKPTEKTVPVTRTDDETAEAAAKDVECKSGQDVRTLSIVTKGTGCDVEYTKAGETKVIGSAQHDRSMCGTLVGKVRGNLESAGFTCE